MTTPNDVCSFCGKDRSQVDQLVRGPVAAICDECIRSGAELLSRSSDLSPSGEVSLQAITSVLNGAETKANPSGPIPSYLAEVRKHPPLPESRRQDLLTRLRTANEAEHREAALREVVTSQLEVVSLLALTACPPNIDSLDAMQEANILFLELIKDPSVEDPLLALAAALPALLKEKAAGGEGSQHRR